MPWHARCSLHPCRAASWAGGVRAPGRASCSFTAGRGWTSGTWTSWRRSSATGSSSRPTSSAGSRRRRRKARSRWPARSPMRWRLDALDWDRAWVVGHSWGGHLLLHLMVAAPQRLQGGLAIELAVCGGAAIFEAQIFARTTEEDRRRAEELDARAMAGEGTERSRSRASAWSGRRTSPPDKSRPSRSSRDDPRLQRDASLKAELPRLEAALPEITIPFGCVAGRASPMPIEHAAAPTVRAIQGAWLEAVDGASSVLTVTSVRLGRSWSSAAARPRRAAPGTPPP